MTQIWSNFVVSGNGCTCCNGVACPPSDRMLLPELTENTGTWYADLATAQGIIANSTNNCVGYWDGSFGAQTFLAENGGTYLNFSETSGSTLATFLMWGSANFASGATINAAFVGGVHFELKIYDSTANIVETVTTTTTPAVSSALPASGRYILSARHFSGPGDPPFSAAYSNITSSGAMTVWPIVALWDNSGSVACETC